MNAARFFELENEGRMKKSVLFMILLTFAGTAVIMNMNQPTQPSYDFKFMAFSLLEEDESYTVNTEASELQWTGRKLTGSHTGTLKLKSGKLILEEGYLTGGSFVIDMTSMTNEDIENEESRNKLMGHLRSDDFFSTANYPEATLKITSVEQGDSRSDYGITADLTIKGKTNSIIFPARVETTNEGLSAEATITFDRTKWDVRYGSGSIFKSLGDKAIYDDVEIVVNLVAGK